MSTQLRPQRVIALRSNVNATYVGVADTHAQMIALDSATDQRDTAFVVRPGLAGHGVSLESLSQPGHFLRHRSFRFELNLNDGTPLFALDASFKERHSGAGISLESVNVPGAFMQATADGVVLGKTNPDAEPSFRVEAAPVERSTSAQTGKVRRFALVLGADEYYDERLANLEGCRNDVIDTVVTLIERGLVQPEDLTPVATPTIAYEELAVRSSSWGQAPNAHTHKLMRILGSHNMRPCFLRWAAHDLRHRMDAARAAGETPMLFLFWSGHGGLVDDRLALKLPGYLPGEQAQLRTMDGMPESIRSLPDEEFDRTDITYDALIDMLGMAENESVFAVIGACHAGAVLEGVAGTNRPADMIFTAGGVDTVLRERHLGGRWRGLLNWSALRVLEQFELHEDDTLKAGMDLSFGQLLHTMRSLVLALQGNSATAWLPQVRGALSTRPELLGHRVGQVFTVAAGATQSAATRVGGGIEWPPDTHGYDVSEGTTGLGTICVSASGNLRIDSALELRLFDATNRPHLNFAVRSKMPTPLGSQYYTSSDLDPAGFVPAATVDCFQVSTGGDLFGYVVPSIYGGQKHLTWYVLDVPAHLQAVGKKVYLKSDFALTLKPITTLPSGTYRQALDKELT